MSADFTPLSWIFVPIIIGQDFELKEKKKQLTCRNNTHRHTPESFATIYSVPSLSSMITTLTATLDTRRPGTTTLRAANMACMLRARMNC